MNNLQKQLLDFATAQYDIDSTPGLPLCCDEHKRLAWWQIETSFYDLLVDERSGPILAEMTCLN